MRRALESNQNHSYMTTLLSRQALLLVGLLSIILVTSSAITLFIVSLRKKVIPYLFVYISTIEEA